MENLFSNSFFYEEFFLVIIFIRRLSQRRILFVVWVMFCFFNFDLNFYCFEIGWLRVDVKLKCGFLCGLVKVILFLDMMFVYFYVYRKWFIV